MPRSYLVFSVFLLAYFLSYFLRSSNAIIAEDLSRDLNLSAGQLGLMTSLFFATFASVQLPLGAALDRYGARYVTPAVMLFGVLGGVLFGFAESFGLLAVGRALIGLATAANLMGALKSISGWFRAEQFARVSSLYLALGSTGALAAATPLAMMAERFGWRSVFFGGAAVSALCALAIVLFAKDAPGDAARSRNVQGSFADIFGDLRFWRVACLNFAVVGSLFAYQGLWAGPYLQEVTGLNKVAAGNTLLVLSGCVTVGYLLAGFLAERFGLVRVMASAGALLTLTQATLVVSRPGQAKVTALFALFGFTAAFGVLMFAQARALFPPHLTGRAVSAVNLFGIGGSAILQSGLGLLIGTFVPVGGVYPPAAYQAAFALTTGLCLAALIFYLPLLRQERG